MRRLLPLVLLVAACHQGQTTAGLGVALFLDKNTVRVHDTLGFTVRLYNTRPDWMTVEFPNAQQAEVLFYDEAGQLAFMLPQIRHPKVSELSLGPWCSHDYHFRVSPNDLGAHAGTYRAHARPADYPAPWTEKTVVLTD